jgi:spore coat protein U-like protein
MRNSRLAFALGFLALNLAARPALAATSTASFSVTATVQSTCLVSAPTAASEPHAAARLEKAATRVSVTCTLPTPYNIDLKAADKTPVQSALALAPEAPNAPANAMTLTITY